MLRTRALSAIILVPFLVVALVIGVPAVATVLVVVALLGGLEVFRLLKEMDFDGFQLAELGYESDDPERIMHYYRGMFDLLKELAEKG